ncbi:MAG: InlB B-repeat-containing protein, partial [Lachnospiraceae bacterium]|nr:InlB B-repeat-containing protein [Lachnospiraceae bacterium]
MKKVLSVFLAIAVMMTSVDLSAVSVFAANEEMTTESLMDEELSDEYSAVSEPEDELNGYSEDEDPSKDEDVEESEISEDDPVEEDETELSVNDEAVEAEETDTDSLQESEFFDGSGTESDPYLIRNVRDLEEMEEFYRNVNVKKYYFKLVNNIVVNSDLSSPGKTLKVIKGNDKLYFDGNNLWITGLYVEADSTDSVVYAAFIENAAEIKDLNINNAMIHCSGTVSNAAVIAGRIKKATNCTVKGDITISSDEENLYDFNTGGLLCWAETVKYCDIYSDVNSDKKGSLSVSGLADYVKAGGIAYNVSQEISHCNMTTDMTVSGKYARAYGIVDMCSKDVTDCIAGDEEGNVECTITVTDSGDYDNGNAYGIAGSGTCMRCSNYATLDASSSAVGIGGDVVKRCENHGALKTARSRQGIGGREIVYCVNYADIIQEEDDKDSNIYGISYSIMGNSYSNENYGNLKGGTIYGITGDISASSSLENLTLSDCTNYGNLTCTKPSEGRVFGICGAVGYYEDIGYLTIIKNCINEGNISNAAYGAGIAEYLENGARVQGCYNIGDISCSWTGAGIVESITRGKNVTVTECYNTGSVSSTNGNGNAAGIVADITIYSENNSVEISNCYNTGTISGKYIGGIAGDISGNDEDRTITIKNCYNRCDYNVSQFGKFYNIVGEDYFTDKTGLDISGCYYSENGAGGIFLKSGEIESGMRKCTDAEMKTQSTYAGWNFDTIWRMGSETYEYPILRNCGGGIFTITLNPNGGTVRVNEVYTSKGKLDSIPRPKLNGMSFKGWYTEADGGERITKTSVFSEDTTIYAHWGVYDEENRVVIFRKNPENGEERVKIREYSDSVGYYNVFQLDFDIADIVTYLDKEAGSVYIIEYDSGKTVYQSDNNSSITITPEDGITHVTVKKGLQSFGVEPGKKYYICVDEGMFNFEDDEKFVMIDQKDVWSFTTATNARVTYRDETKKRDTMLSYEFTWEDIDLSGSSYDFNWNLSTFAYGATLSAFESYSGTYSHGESNFASFMSAMGFDHISSNSAYSLKPKPDSIGVAIASKNTVIGGTPYTVIVAAIRGAGYEAEWASNVKVGWYGDHDGFEDAAQKAEEFISLYMANPGNEVGSNVKIIVTGYSRAAATANLTTVFLDDHAASRGINLTDIYGFCFEPPAPTIRADKPEYHNIYNFINPRDLVPKVPSSRWGFRHPGVKLYYPDGDSNSDDYGNLYKKFKKTLADITTYGQYNGSAQTSYIYDESKFVAFGGKSGSMRQWLNELTDNLTRNISRNTFYDELQSIAYDSLSYGLGGVVDVAGNRIKIDVGLWDDMKPLEILLSALLYCAGKKMTYGGIKNFLGDYAIGRDTSGLHIPAEHMGLFYRLPDAALGFYGLYLTFTDYEKLDTFTSGLFYYAVKDHESPGNLIFQEHEPVVNFAWHLVCKDIGSYSSGVTRSIKVKCPVDVRLYDKETGELAGEFVDDEASEIEGSPVTAYLDKDGQKVFVVPLDREYDVNITATDAGNLDYSVLERSEEDGYLKRIDFLNIDIEKGSELTGEILEDSSAEEDHYTLEMDGNSIEGTVLAQNEITYHEITLSVEEGQENLGTVMGSGVSMINENREI